MTKGLKSFAEICPEAERDRVVYFRPFAALALLGDLEYNYLNMVGTGV